MKFLVYSAATVAALLTVLSTRLLIPAAVLVFKMIEQSFAPDTITGSTPVLSPIAVAEPVVATPATPATAAVTATPAASAKPKRATRKRAASKRVAAVAEAVA